MSVSHYIFNQQKLNERDSAWKELAMEQNPHVLAEIMWSWLDHLKVLVYYGMNWIISLLTHISSSLFGFCVVIKNCFKEDVKLR